MSSSAQAAYIWFKLEWRGVDNNNNGKLRLSVRQLAQRMGVRPDTAAEAIRELQRKGYLFQTESACLGIDGAAKSPAWELTELKMPGTDKTQDGRKLYREWQPGRDYPVQGAGANNPRGENGRRTKPRHENRDGPVLISVTKNRVAS